MLKQKPITELARVIRSKIAGPYELTFDIIMKDIDSYKLVKNSGVINKKLICDLYKISEDKILVLQEYEPALAFKITIIKPVESGNIYDTDVMGAQQHAPLLDILIPSP